MKTKLIALFTLFFFFTQTTQADGVLALGAAAFAHHAREKHKEHHKSHLLTSIAVAGVAGSVALGIDFCSKPKNRDDDRCAAGRELVGINGHPTDLIYEKSSTLKLRKNLLAVGEPSAKGCAAHHIVAQEDKRPTALDSRELLEQCNIDIDDAINGVHLPHNKNAECAGANHRTLHTEKYYTYVYQLFRRAFPSGCEALKGELSGIKRDLLNNNTPWEKR